MQSLHTKLEPFCKNMQVLQYRITGFHLVLLLDKVAAKFTH